MGREQRRQHRWTPTNDGYTCATKGQYNLLRRPETAGNVIDISGGIVRREPLKSLSLEANSKRFPSECPVSGVYDTQLCVRNVFHVVTNNEDGFHCLSLRRTAKDEMQRVRETRRGRLFKGLVVSNTRDKYT